MTKLRPKSKPSSKTKSKEKVRPTLPKAPTGIQGLDEITEGGLPKGGPTLVCGGAGCGQSPLMMEFNDSAIFMANVR